MSAFMPTRMDNPNGELPRRGGDPNLDLTVERVTPDDAHRYLATMDNPRKFRPMTAQHYAGDMASGNWAVGNSALLFDGEGKLRDGQHRLHACIIADVPFITVVIRNVSEEAVANTDRGLTRAYRDILVGRGVPHATHVQAAVNLGWRWDHGHILSRTAMRPTITQSDQWLAANEEVIEAVVSVQGWKRVLGGIPSVMATFRYRITTIDAGAAEVFAEGLTNGVNLEMDSSVRRLRDRMMTDRAQQLVRRSSSNTQVMQLALMCKAWNAFVLDLPVKQLMWRRGSQVREAFPDLLDMDGRAYPFPEVIARAERD